MRPRPVRFGDRRAFSSSRSFPDGAWCLFPSPVTGTRQGKIVLAQHRSIHNPETGGSYTLKVYKSEKAKATAGTWRHVRIILEPLNPA